MIEKCFRHSGKLGDIIYSLPTVRAMGGGRILLNENPAIGARLTPDLRRSIAELLRMQPYVTAVDDFRDQADFIDLDAFRTRPLTENLADQHLRTFGLDPRERDTRWLWVDGPEILDGKPVVINRSNQHHDPGFPWDQVRLKYCDVAVFVGTPQEHRDFVAAFGDIEYKPTETLADLARLIAGSKLFIGNQSCPYAIAEGLKVNTIQETSRPWSNCVFSRANAAYSIAGPVVLPEIESGRSDRPLQVGGEQNNAPIFGFMHVAMVNHWNQIVEEQLLKLRASGLWDRTERLFIGLLGTSPEELTITDPKVIPMYFGADYRPAELPTLSFLQRFCRTRECLAYYVHTKGVFSPSNGTRDWRHSMEHFVITRHQDCVEALSDHDLCGINWHESWCRFFGGNFWWARSDYVRTLPDIRSLQPIPGLDLSARHVCERWVGENPAVRAISLHESQTHHYRDEYPRSRYAHVHEILAGGEFDCPDEWKGLENGFQDLIEPAAPVSSVLVVGLNSLFILHALTLALPGARVIGIDECCQEDGTASQERAKPLHMPLSRLPNIVILNEAAAATSTSSIDVLVINGGVSPPRMWQAFDRWESKLRLGGCVVFFGTDGVPEDVARHLRSRPGRIVQVSLGGGISVWYKPDRARSKSERVSLHS